MMREKREEILKALQIIISKKDELTHREFLKDELNEEIIANAIEASVVLANLGGVNLHYNMKYREISASNIKHKFLSRNKSFYSNGIDDPKEKPFEYKSVTLKNKNLIIHENFVLGEVDKIFNKMNDDKYNENTKNDFLFSIFERTSSIPIISFYLSSEDFSKNIFPLILNKSKELIKKSNNLKIKTRDSYAFKMENFLKCPSFKIVHLNKNFKKDIIVKKDLFDKTDFNLRKDLEKYLKEERILIK